MYFQSTDENFHFIHCETKIWKRNIHFKNCMYPVFWFCFNINSLLFYPYSGGRKGKRKKSVVHEFDSTSYAINFILFLLFFIHKAALWHHSCALVWKGKEKTSDTVCSLPMAPGTTCFSIMEAEQKIKLKW